MIDDELNVLPVYDAIAVHVAARAALRFGWVHHKSKARHQSGGLYAQRDSQTLDCLDSDETHSSFYQASLRPMQSSGSSKRFLRQAATSADSSHNSPQTPFEIACRHT